MNVTTITSTCPACGRRFDQPDDPGRKRKFCTNACRQADYRSRLKAKAEAARQARERAEQQAREQASQERKERRRQQARSRRQQSYGTPADWWSPRVTDTATQAKARATCARLIERAEHPKTNAHEAKACREKAESLREKKGL